MTGVFERDWGFSVRGEGWGCGRGRGRGALLLSSQRVGGVDGEGYILTFISEGGMTLIV